MYLARTALIGDTFQIELEFRNVGFWGEGKTGVPGEKPLGARTRTNNKLNPHMTPRPGIEPGPHWWEASALTTAPSLLPIMTSILSRNCYVDSFWNFYAQHKHCSRVLRKDSNQLVNTHIDFIFSQPTPPPRLQTVWLEKFNSLSAIYWTAVHLSNSLVSFSIFQYVLTIKYFGFYAFE